MHQIKYYVNIYTLHNVYADVLYCEQAELLLEHLLIAPAQ